MSFPYTSAPASEKWQKSGVGQAMEGKTMPPKWDDATPSEKLLTLFALLLFNKRAFSLTELAGRNCLNASKASVGRLIRQLERANVGNLRREKRGRESLYRLERPTPPPTISLNADGLYQLALCRDFLTHLLPEKIRAETQASLSQALSFLTQDSQNLTPSIGASLSKGRIDYTPFQDIIASLMEAMHQRKVCRIEYVSATEREKKHYAFAPIRLLAYHECLYVDGWRVTDLEPAAPLYDEPLRLAVQRFHKCRVTTRRVDGLPPLPENQAMGIRQGQVFPIRVWFTAEAATYVVERQWSEDQTVEEREDGSIILTASMSSVSECISWLLSFGDQAQLLEPDWLVTELTQTVSAMLKQYKKENINNIV